MSASFEIVCEIEPATRPDLQRVRLQIGTLAAVADAFLVPDNHIGRATVSSVAVAHEVGAMGARAIACLNARDRNVLGFRRDLLTAAAYGVDEFLFVYGDRPSAGARVEPLSVKDMIREVRTFETGKKFRVGITSGSAPIAELEAGSRLLFRADRLRRRRARPLAGHRGVRGQGVRGCDRAREPSMARKLSSDLRDVAIPDTVQARLEREPRGGVELACDLVDEIRDRGGFDGVHLIPVGRYRETAALLEARARS